MAVIDRAAPHLSGRHNDLIGNQSYFISETTLIDDDNNNDGNSIGDTTEHRVTPLERGVLVLYMSFDGIQKHSAVP